MDKYGGTNKGYSLEDFRRMVMTLTPEQLASIPIDQLPDEIPEELLDAAPAISKPVIEEIIFELNTREIHLQMEYAERFPPEIVDALNLTRHFAQLPYQELFNARVSELLLLYKRGEKSLDAKERQWQVAKIREIDRVIPEFKMESKCIVRAYLLLEDGLAHAAQFRPRFEVAIQELKRRFAQIDGTLGRYFFLRLAIIGNEMLRHENKIKNSQTAILTLQDKIDLDHFELEKLKSSFGFFTAKAKGEMIEKLKENIRANMEEKKTQEVLISETDLTGWFDVVVDASISSLQPRNSEAILRKVRNSLYRLLNYYCLLQEQAALQIARNPFLQNDPKKMIRFMLQSEQFILNYFAEKRSEMAAWLGDAAESRIEKLGVIEKELLKELKRNAKLR